MKKNTEADSSPIVPVSSCTICCFVALHQKEGRMKQQKQKRGANRVVAVSTSEDGDGVEVRAQQAHEEQEEHQIQRVQSYHIQTAQKMKHKTTQCGWDLFR